MNIKGIGDIGGIRDIGESIYSSSLFPYHPISPISLYPKKCNNLPQAKDKAGNDK
jgi:hypothetical protein